MKKICVVTATRAEYGLLKNVIKKIEEDSTLELCLIVTGSHLEEEYGNTVEEIVEDGFPIAARIKILNHDATEKGIVTAMTVAMEKFGKTLWDIKPDMLVVLGDRYELLPICEVALMYKIPIAHISGGEITEGAIDDTVRHCITKMSHLHFPGCEAYRKRIIQMGEQPDHVYNYGDVGIENILKMQYLSKEELQESIKFSLQQPYACVTFHPVTLDNQPVEEQIQELLSAIEQIPELNYIFTGSNADAGGQVINEKIQEFVSKHDNCRYYSSLGIRRYLSLLKMSEMIIGNSSSGIVEAPCFGIPTVNIGNRQKGRLQADSILNCLVKKDSILKTIKYAMSEQCKKQAAQTVNPYGSGNTSEGIVKEIKHFLSKEKDLNKTFYDIKGEWEDEQV